MNGNIFILDIENDDITSMTGKNLSHYNNTWVLSKEPERKDGASYGADDEWETLYDLETEEWIKTSEKPMRTLTDNFTPVEANIVDSNILGAFVDYVVQYVSDDGACLYYRERNIDGLFRLENYSVYNNTYNKNSIIGAYDNNQSYIKNFNNSVMIYPNIRKTINGNTAIGLSYTLSWNRIGSILTPFGDLLEDYIVSFYIANNKQYIISKTGSGYIRVTRLGVDIPDRIERIAQYIHKINTVDTVNIIVEKVTSIQSEIGSLDWNNKFLIKNNIIDTVLKPVSTYHVNSGYNPLYEVTKKRSSSMIVSDTSFELFGILTDAQTDNAYNLEFTGTDMFLENIDVFYGTVQPSIYRYSITNGNQRINTDLDGLLFPLGVMAPFPVGTEWSLQNEIASIGKTSHDLLAVGLTDGNKTLDLYLYSNQVYFGQDSFDLFGVQYIYDGDYIYQGNERIAMAFGYKYIGCDNASAYFYNTWDNSIYQFNGSRSLTKYIDMSNRKNILIGRYDGYSGEMILITEDEILKSRNNSIMNYPYVAENSRHAIIPTKKGSFIKLNDGSRVLLSPKDGNTEPFEIVTSYIGVDGSTVCDYERVDVRLYSPDKSELSFFAELQTINQDTKESEQKLVELSGHDWSIDGYKTIRLTPKYKKGTGLSLRIYSDMNIYVTGIEFTYNPSGRTANGQRNGL